MENFIKNIQNNIQEYIKSIIILPEENIREGQNNFYKDEFSLLIDNNEDYLSTKWEFARLSFNPKYVYLRTRYMDLNSFFGIMDQIDDKDNIEFSLQDRGRWQYQLRILTRKINDSEYEEILNTMLISAVKNTGDKELIRTSFGVIYYYFKDQTMNEIIKKIDVK